MTRLDGEKKSPLPWIIGLIVLALLAAAIYYFTVAKGTDAVVVNENGVEMINNAPGGLGEENATDANATDANSMDANATDANAMDANSTDTNAMSDANAVDSNGAMTGNSAMMDSNSAMGDSNAMDSNSAMMSNSATSDSAMSDSNSAMMSNSTGDAATPGVTPASSSAGAGGNDVIATRSKTIETGKATVTYKKSVKADGSLMRDKTIVPKPVANQ